MNELVRNCYNYLLNLTAELAADFETQINSMEEFARWNLPEEIALEWLDAEGMLQILKESAACSNIELDSFEQIISNFNSAFEESLTHVWSHTAMQNDNFWFQQRKIAQRILNLHSPAKSSREPLA